MLLRRATRLGVVVATSSAAIYSHRAADNASSSTTTTFLQSPGTSERYSVTVALPSPPSAAERRKRQAHHTIYVLDMAGDLFQHVVRAAAAQARAAEAEGRSWAPDLLVVGVVPERRRADPASLTRFVSDTVVPFIDESYRTKPYASGRVLCGNGDGGAGTGTGGAVARALLENHVERFGHYLVGCPSEEDAGAVAAAAAAPEPRRLPRSVYLWSDAGSTRTGALRRLDARLNGAVCAADADVPRASVVRVDRDGNQRVESLTQVRACDSAEAPGEEPNAAATTAGGSRISSLHVSADGRLGDDAFATHAVEWLARRLEQSKIDSLGTLMPWSEFR